jgi:ornithine cyclodeaminase/alanine dehydrogenase-like protein (mu-crystallin family)
MIGSTARTFPMPGYEGTELRFVSRAEVIAACGGLDLLGVVTDALIRHADGATLLPAEAYLPWQAPDGAFARSLAMPGGLRSADRGLVLGLKVINGSLSNPSRGLARAQGLVMLFDPQTARPAGLMEAAYISAARTAAVTAVTAQRLGVPGLEHLAVLGCGALARAHLALLPDALPSLRRVSLYDLDPVATQALAADLRGTRPELTVVAADDARSAVDGAQLVVPVTTTTTGYIGWDWLAPGALVAHVSLDDVLPEVAERADLLVVDDWDLVAADDRRLLGRMYRDGRLRGPDGSWFGAGNQDEGSDVRRVDATLGDVLTGRHPGRRSASDIVLSNPFGMSILDIALASEVLNSAGHSGTGRLLTL